MIKIAIVEDDRDFAKVLIDHLERYEKERGISFSPRYFRDGEDIVAEYTEDYDLILMDIQLKFLSGMEAAKQIRQRDEDVLILFLTATAQFSIEGYQVHAFDYLLKPISYETLASRLDLALSYRHRRRDAFLLVHVPDGIRKVRASNIYYIESQGHVMQLHTQTGILETHARLSDLEKELPQGQFFRCHKGYLVNLEHVSGISETDCLVKGDRLPVSRRRKKEFMDRLAEVL